MNPRLNSEQSWNYLSKRWCIACIFTRRSEKKKTEEEAEEQNTLCL